MQNPRTDLQSVQQQARKITIEDVARVAKVHAATVSRALSGGTVAPATRLKVERVARELGYRPSAIAASMRSQRSNLIGVIVPDLGNPLFGPIVQCLERELRAAGLLTLVVQTPQEDARARREVVLALSEHKVAGLVISAAQTDDPMLDAAHELAMPVVLVNRGYGERRFAGVVNDDHESVRLVLDHLHELGHRRILHVAGPQTSSTGRARKEAFVQLARAPRFESAQVVEAQAFQRDAGREAMGEAIASGVRFTAVFAANDLLALGVLDALRAAGLEVPDSVSLVGHNDMPLVDLIDPPLTTVHIELEQMSRQATALLLDRLRDPAEAPTTRVLMPKLVVRASTGPVSTDRKPSEARRGPKSRNR